MSLLLAAWRDRGLWVLVFPQGLLRWQRGAVASFPWDEIERVSFSRVLAFGPVEVAHDATGAPESAWLPLGKSGTKMLGGRWPSAGTTGRRRCCRRR